MTASPTSSAAPSSIGAPKRRARTAFPLMAPMLLATILLAATLAGCAKAPPPAPTFGEIGFASQPAIHLAVQSIDTVQEYTPPLQLPNVEHVFPVPPAQMAAAWARDRLRAAGGPNTARFIVKRASVVEAQLPLTQGITGAFTKDQAKRYDAILEVQLDILNDRGFVDGTVSVQAVRSQTVAEDASHADLERAWYGMTKALGDDMNQQMTNSIAVNLTRFLSVAP